MACNPYTIKILSIIVNGVNNGAEVFTSSNNGSFLVNDDKTNLRFVINSNTPISDSTGLGYSLTILSPFQGEITQTLNNSNNNNTGNDTATLAGVINVTTPVPLNVTKNPEFAIKGYLSSNNFSVYTDQNQDPLSLTITLDSTSICSTGTYGGVVSFAVVIAGSKINNSNTNQSVTLTSQIVPPSTLSLNPNDYIVNQILNSVNSISNSIQSLSDSLNQLNKNLSPPKLNLKVL
jgi:hypothetical protein